jgi:type I restriction enzyme, R subunit
MSGQARQAFAAFIPAGDVGKFADTLRDRLKNDFTATMQILRNPAFQELLLNYDRVKRPFYVAYSVEDAVSSEVLFKIQETQFRPADYLTAFAEFVRTHQDQITALSILFHNPRQWNSSVLRELRRTLQHYAFPEEDLRKAHALAGQHAFADIISMLKHAANAQQPLLSAEERVNYTLNAILAQHAFTPEQQGWLAAIRQHLIVNLAIEPETFDLMPVFERRGGLAKARKVFGGELDGLLAELNYRLAA